MLTEMLYSGALGESGTKTETILREQKKLRRIRDKEVEKCEEDFYPIPRMNFFFNLFTEMK